MAKIQIEVEIPDYEIKYCDSFNGTRCKWLERHGYFQEKNECKLSGKRISKTKDNGDTVVRPYGCRVVAKKNCE